MAPRPRFGPLENVALSLPAGKKIGAALAITLAPNGDMFLLHQAYAPGFDYGAQRTTEGWLPDVVHLTADGKYVNA